MCVCVRVCEVSGSYLTARYLNLVSICSYTTRPLLRSERPRSRRHANYVSSPSQIDLEQSLPLPPSSFLPCLVSSAGRFSYPAVDRVPLLLFGVCSQLSLRGCVSCPTAFVSSSYRPPFLLRVASCAVPPASASSDPRPRMPRHERFRFEGDLADVACPPRHRAG